MVSQYYSCGQDIPLDILKAQALLENKKTGEAINILSSAIAADKTTGLYLERAEVYMSLGQLDKAISDLVEADNISPGAASFGLARVYALKGDAATAIGYLEKNMGSGYKMREKEVLLDQDLSRISNSQEWKQFIKKEWYSRIEKSISEIEYYISLGRTGEAMDILNELKSDYAEDNKLTYIEGYIKYASGQYREATTIMAPLVQEEPANADYVRLLADASFANGDYAGAAMNYLGLLKVGDADAIILLKLAECYKGGLDYDEAASYVDLYLSLYPSDTDALSLGGSIERAAGNYNSALRYYSKCLEANSGEPRFYIDRADTYFMVKSWELAANDYGMALDLNPDNSESWLNKGISHLNLRQEDTGCFCLKMAQKMGDDRASFLLERNCE